MMEVSSQLVFPTPTPNTLNNSFSVMPVSHFYGTSDNGNYAAEIGNSNADQLGKIQSSCLSSTGQVFYQASPGERKVPDTPVPIQCTKSIRGNPHLHDDASQPKASTDRSVLTSTNVCPQDQNPISTTDCDTAGTRKELSARSPLHQDPSSTLPEQEKKSTTASEPVNGTLNPYCLVKKQPRLLIPPRELKTTDVILNGIKYQKHVKTQPQCQPILYSAIGSLETYNQFNIGSFDKKIVAAEKLRAVTNSRNNQVSAKRGSRKLNNEKFVKKNNQAPKQQDTASQKSLQQSDKKTAIKVDKSLDENYCQGNEATSMTSTPALATEVSTENPSNEIPEAQKKHQSGRIQTQESKRKPNGSRVKRGTVDRKVQIQKQPVEMFRPSCDAYTPRMGKKSIKFKPAEERTSMGKMAGTMGSLQRPNFRDALRRVSMIIRQHVVKIEERFASDLAMSNKAGLFSTKMRDLFNERNFLTPRYRCNLLKIPMAKGGIVCGMREINIHHETPTESEIYEFAHQLFKSVRLSSECSIVCLIYVERIMELGKVPLLPSTWKPIFMCGLLLASKVWQDLSSWNIEFASVYPQYSPDAINRLEVLFLRTVKWDLYISSSLYAKYYFALRSILEKQDFRHRYNMLVGAAGKVTASQALKIEKRTTIIKEEALLQLSKSM